MSGTCFAAALPALVDALDLAIRPQRPTWRTVDAVVDALAPFLGRPDLLTPAQQVGDPAGYRAHVLHVPGDGAWSLMGMVWLPGQTTPVHDHVSWCVVGVQEGEELESRYRLVDDHLIEDVEVTSRQGSVAGLLPPGDIHRVTNSGTGTTISLHVYGVDVRQRGTSIRRRYDLPIASAAVRAV
jgi:predicted metal-dependent enzyme (double-stranded beta helix superfamily)